MPFPKEMKYVMVNFVGHELPIIFPTYMIHADMAPRDMQVISAGFCRIAGEDVRCYGKSITLKKESRPQDSSIVRNCLYDYTLDQLSKPS